MSEIQNTTETTQVVPEIQTVDEVYTHARLKAMRDDANISRCRNLAQRIKSDFLEDFTQKSASSVSLWRKIYEGEIDNIVMLFKEIRLFFPDIYIGISLDYRGNINILIKPFELKNPTDL